MSITPTGGWGTRNDVVWNSTGRQQTVCPTCYSEDWRAASLVHNEGLTLSAFQMRGRSTSVGRVGLRNGQFAVGVSTYKGTGFGMSQTATSRMAQPPMLRRGAQILLFLAGLPFSFITLFLCIGLVTTKQNDVLPGMVLALLICGTIAAACFLTANAVRTRRKAAYGAAIDQYERMRMCQRCGAFFSD